MSGYPSGNGNGSSSTSSPSCVPLFSASSSGSTSPPTHVATPHSHKSMARVQGAASAPVVATCSPSLVSVAAGAGPASHSVAPHVATVSTVQPSDSSAEVLSVFECPVCLDFCLPPYLQCQSGHLVCSNCRPKLQCCPTCRGPTPSVRNLALEKIANTVKFPCKFSTSGCTAIMHHQEKLEHEEQCEHRPYLCPCPGASCKWQGSLGDVMGHLMKVHKSITTLQGEDIVFLATDINLPGAVDWVMMQSAWGSSFILVLEKQEKFEHGTQMFYAVVQLIGSKREAEKFIYKLELSTTRRRLCWEAVPRSIHEGVASAINASDCLFFDSQTAQLFADNGNLGINVTINLAPGVASGLSSSSSDRP